MRSESLPVADINTARPSSLQRPTLSKLMPSLIELRMHSPMSSQTSTPSNAPIETLNYFFISFLVHTFPLVSYRKVYLECIIVSYI